jgi:dienelactone hydrolase
LGIQIDVLVLLDLVIPNCNGILGTGGALALAFAAKMAERNTPLDAAVSFYGVPLVDSKLLAKLPKSTPVHVHFGNLDSMNGLSDPASANKLATAWFVLFADTI